MATINRPVLVATILLSACAKPVPVGMIDALDYISNHLRHPCYQTAYGPVYAGGGRRCPSRDEHTDALAWCIREIGENLPDAQVTYVHGRFTCAGLPSVGCTHGAEVVVSDVRDDVVTLCHELLHVLIGDGEHLDARWRGL